MHDAYIGRRFQWTKITRKASDLAENLQLNRVVRFFHPRSSCTTTHISADFQRITLNTSCMTISSGRTKQYSATSLALGVIFTVSTTFGYLFNWFVFPGISPVLIFGQISQSRYVCALLKHNVFRGWIVVLSSSVKARTEELIFTICIEYTCYQLIMVSNLGHNAPGQYVPRTQCPQYKQ